MLKKLQEFINGMIPRKHTHGSMQTMMDTIPVIMTVWDVNFNMMDCNAEILRLLGISEKQEYIENFFKYSPPIQPDGTPSPEKVAELIGEAIEKGSLKLEWCHQDVHGELIPVDTTVIIGEYRGEAALFVYGTDKRELKAVSDRLQAMFDATPLVIDYWDRDFNCIDCNQFAVDFYGLRDKDEYMRRVLELVPESQPDGSVSVDMWLRHMEKAFELGNYTFNYVALKPDGVKIHYEVITVRVEMSGQPIVAAYSRDVSEKVHAEAAEANSLAKSRFLAKMSHEIRTPITAVLGISEIQLQNTGLTPEVEEAFAKIHNSSTTLLDIVNDILDLSAIEAGKMRVAQEKYAIESLISDIAQLHLVNLGSRSINFNIRIDPQIPLELIGDSVRIKQIFNNILSNSFKYTTEGEVTLYLARQDADTDGRIILSAAISDTGRGMTNTQVAALFDDYTRFHTEEANHISGTGLGMPIVYSLVKLMGADIDVESMVGQGTTVVVHIPQKMSGPEVLGEEKAGRLEQFLLDIKKGDFVQDAIPHGSVLVVDDVEANLYVARGMLGFYDLEIETCTTGYEAIEKIKAGRSYDIIFMDQMMPGITGMEAVQRLRGMGYKAPIVALTADAFIGRAEEFLRVGFDGYISKPIQAVHLNTVLNKFIQNKVPKVLNEEFNDLMDDQDFLQKMQQTFIEDHGEIFSEIMQAISGGDIKEAHRLAHTLKGVAALIKESELSETAEKAERILGDGQLPEASEMEDLRDKLDLVLRKIDFKQ